MKEKELVPKRRFDEFQNTDAWEQRKLGDIYQFKYGQFNNNPDNGGEYPIYGANGVIGGYHEYNAENSIVIGHMGAYAGHVLWAPGRHFVTYNGTIGFPKIMDFDKKFGYHMLQYINIPKITAGSGQPFVSYADLDNIKINIPINIEEQTYIGEVFDQLNNLITLHQRKLKKTKALKSAYLAEMFPAEGKRVPKRRFAGFTGEWEEIQLGELGFTFSGLSGKTKKDFGHGDAEFVTYMNVFKNEISQGDLTEKVTLDNKQTELKYGDILFTTSSETPHEVGMSSVWLENKKNVYLNSFCFGLRPSVILNNVFIAYLLRSNVFRKEMEVLAQGISRYNISKTKVMQIHIYLPQDEEQQVIGTFFKKLDDKISNQQHKLNKLKAMKQAYLEEMFV